MNANDVYSAQTSLLRRALEVTKTSNASELRKIFDGGLGNTREGRKILNSKDFSFDDIKAIRSLLQKK